MAYSMFDCPKLHQAKSMKFYPEEYEHRVSFRHKNLPPNFDLTIEEPPPPAPACCPYKKSKKCPIYVHNLPQIDKTHYTGDCGRRLKTKQTLEKLEESYWANWKPKPGQALKSPDNHCKRKAAEIQVIKSAPSARKCKNKNASTIVAAPNEDRIESQIESDTRNSSRSQEIQTEISTIAGKIADLSLEDAPPPSRPEERTDHRFLKHTDSFILTSKKVLEESKEEKFEQPRCIRLYRKVGKMPSTKNFVKGGSYPLKSCLKKESQYAPKGSLRLGRPGSPIICSSNFSGRSSRGHKRLL